MASIELHDSILNKNHKNLIDENDILNNKTIINGINIPNRYHLNLINIASCQINSEGFRYKKWHLKNMYDSLVLNLVDEFGILERKDPYIADYISKLKAIFRDVQISQTHSNQKQLKNYQIRLKHFKLYEFFSKIRYLYFYILKRIRLILSNRSYRHHILKNKFLKKR